MRSEYLKSVAVMNLKKAPGAGATDDERLRKAADRDANLLGGQFELYQPTLVIAACGDGRLVPQLSAGWQRTSRGHWFTRFGSGGAEGVALGMWHSQAHLPARLMYYAFLDAFREVAGVG